MKFFLRIEYVSRRIIFKCFESAAEMNAYRKMNNIFLNNPCILWIHVTTHDI